MQNTMTHEELAFAYVYNRFKLASLESMHLSCWSYHL